MTPSIFTEMQQLDPYAWLISLGGAAFVGLTLSRASKPGIDRSRLAVMLVGTYLGALASARLFFVIEHHWGQDSLLRLFFSPVVGGFAAWGAVLGGVAAGFLLLRVLRLPATVVADLAVPGLCVLAVLGRVGCFLAGCCYGHPSSLPWAVHYPPGVPAGDFTSAGLHPTQIYEALLMCMVGLAALRFSRSRRSGVAFLWLIFLYACLRFALGFLRADHAAVLAGLGLAQLVGLLVAILSMALLWKYRATFEQTARQ